jgi:membrane-associated protease RseP (regulator of RpoE activity)
VAPPSSANTIACFRNQPAGYPEAHDAEAVKNRLAGKYGLRKSAQARTNPVDASPLQFSLYPSFLLLPQTSPDQIVFLEPRATQRTILIGVMNDWENPCASMDEFKRRAATAAAILGGQAVQIRSESGPFRRGGSGDFAAALLLIPKARLGLQDEGGQWKRTELVVQGFDKESLAPAAGLQVGDRIVAVNGTDVLQEKRFADAWLSWAVGATVVVTFVRDGMEMSLQAKTIPNWTRIE